MNPLEKEIEKIRYELAVTIPEELRNATFSDDILESSEYSEILSRQYLLNVRLIQLNKRVHQVNSLDLNTISHTHVDLGSVVEIQCKHTGKLRLLKIISCEMSDISDIYEEVTLSSPLGKSLCKKTINDDIIVHTPLGVQHYKIISLRTAHDV